MKKSLLPHLLIVFAAAIICFSWSELLMAVPVKLTEQQDISLSDDGNGSPFEQENKDIPKPNRDRNQIVCISDIHLGIDTTYAECKNNRETLIKFLEQVGSSSKVKELVIAGDFLDEWYIPANVETFNGKSQRDFVKTIADINKSVIAALNAIIKERKVKVTYMPGNHDLLISSEDIQSILPGIAQVRDVKGLGAYSPVNHPEIIIEHGHRYNFFCAPDPFSNQSIAPGSILPPGYFFTRIAALSVEERKLKPKGSLLMVIPESQQLMYKYWYQWNKLMFGFPIKEGFNEKIIKTNIDGYKANYSINDLMPFQLENGVIDVMLFKGIEKRWPERQLRNKVAVPIPALRAISRAESVEESDEQASVQYFLNPRSNKRVVVFGHTHEAKIIPSKNHKGQKTIYANSGTWIDSKIDKNSISIMTFVVITPKKRGAAQEFVDLYRYWPNGKITRLANDSLTNVNKQAF